MRSGRGGPRGIEGSGPHITTGLQGNWGSGFGSGLWSETLNSRLGVGLGFGIWSVRMDFGFGNVLGHFGSLSLRLVWFFISISVLTVSTDLYTVYS